MVLNLKKNEPLNLTKNESTASLDVLVIGAGWDTANNGPDIDLDLVCSANDKTFCYFNALSVFGGAIAHTGDNRTGEGDGADEEIKVKLKDLPENIDRLVFAISSYSGQNFDQIENEFIQIADNNGNVLAKSSDDVAGQGKTLVLAEVTKKDNEWSINVLNEMLSDDFNSYAQKVAA